LGVEQDIFWMLRIMEAWFSNRWLLVRDNWVVMSQ
jgi:hypothetical protein